MQLKVSHADFKLAASIGEEEWYYLSANYLFVLLRCPIIQFWGKYFNDCTSVNMSTSIPLSSNNTWTFRSPSWTSRSGYITGYHEAQHLLLCSTAYGALWSCVHGWADCSLSLPAKSHDIDKNACYQLQGYKELTAPEPWRGPFIFGLALPPLLHLWKPGQQPAWYKPVMYT